MDEVQERSNSECHTPSSELFRIYFSFILPAIVLRMHGIRLAYIETENIKHNVHSPPLGISVTLIKSSIVYATHADWILFNCFETELM
jgi:hypothetical protein